MMLEVPPAIVRLAGAVTNEGPINLRSVFPLLIGSYSMCDFIKVIDGILRLSSIIISSDDNNSVTAFSKFYSLCRKPLVLLV